jgi:hypothetical protein
MQNRPHESELHYRDAALLIASTKSPADLSNFLVALFAGFAAAALFVICATVVIAQDVIDWALFRPALPSLLLVSGFVAGRCFYILLGEYWLRRPWGQLDSAEQNLPEGERSTTPRSRVRASALTLLRSAEALSAASSSTLFTAAGGGVAMMAAEVLAFYAPDLTQPLRLGLTLAGMMLGYLLWRRRYRISVERGAEAQKARRETLVSQLGDVRKLLAAERRAEPTSPLVAAELERQYLDLVRQLGETPLPPSPLLMGQD